MAKVDQRCNFCGKRHDQVRKLVAGPGIFICDQCIELAHEIVHREGPPAPESPGRRAARRQTGSRWFRNLFRVHGYMT